MTRCCSNIFLNQFTQQPPDVIVDPPGASLCYHYEDIEFPGSIFDISALTMDYVTIGGVQTVLNKDVFVDWGWFGAIGFDYTAVVTDLAAASITAGVEGMGFFIASTINTALGIRFSITGDSIVDCSVTYTYDAGAGPVQVTSPITQSNCEIEYGCYEATYTPENPFLIENGNITAITNNGLTLFETLNSGVPCPAKITDQVWQDFFQSYVQTIHGTQATTVFDFTGNTLTLQVLNTLLVPAHMDNIADSGCVAPNSTPQVNLFTAIDCP